MSFFKSKTDIRFSSTLYYDVGIRTIKLYEVFCVAKSTYAQVEQVASKIWLIRQSMT